MPRFVRLFNLEHEINCVASDTFESNIAFPSLLTQQPITAEYTPYALPEALPPAP